MRRTYLAVLLAMSIVPAALAQQDSQAERAGERFFFVSGYGTAGLTATRSATGTNSAFETGFNPIVHFQVSDRIHFAGELEFEFEGNATVTNLEYAEIDLMLPGNLVLRAGKFLLPVGEFIDRLHPTWINRFPSTPPILGHEGGPEGVEPLLPIAADIGVLAGYAIPMGGGRTFTLQGFVTQGPQAEPGMDEVELMFGNSVSDNNTNKMIGGRAGLLLAPALEVLVSGARTSYDSAGALHFAVLSAAGSWQRGPLTVRGELLRTSLELQDTTMAVETVKRWGFYAQGSWRLRTFEPVLRFALLGTDDESDERRSQIGVGLNYWFNSSTAIMAGYEVNGERGAALDNNRFLIHWSFGF